MTRRRHSQDARQPSSLERKPRSMKSPRRILAASRAPFAVLLAVAAMAAPLAVPAPAAAAAPAPGWSIDAISYSTSFLPESTNVGYATFGDYLISAGPHYRVTATNVGQAATSGEWTVTDTLPAGVSLAPQGASGITDTYAEPTCGSSGATVTCHSTEVILPGESVKILIPVEIAAGAPEEVFDEASVEGGGASGEASTSLPTTISASEPPFGFAPGDAGFGLGITDRGGSAATEAGTHPYQLTVKTGWPVQAVGFFAATSIEGGARDLEMSLPEGVIVDPGATPARCTEALLESEAGGVACPDASQVGIVKAEIDASSILKNTVPLYNVVPPPGHAAEFAFDPGIGAYIHLLGGVSRGGTYRLAVDSGDIPAKAPLISVRTTLWGNPSDESHDGQRGECAHFHGNCPIEPRSDKPLLTMPTSCSSSLPVSARLDSWANPGIWVRAATEAHDATGAPLGVEGCSRLLFHPQISVRPDVERAESPSGLEVDLRLPYVDALNQPVEADLKDATVRLPEGMALNPSAAGGLESCSPAQIGLTSPVGQTPARFDEAGSGCPDGAKIGSVELVTPLLDHPLPGAVYVAAPRLNPFGSLMAIYIVIDDPQSGVVIKLAGHVVGDPQTGQLTTTFSENPQLPFEEMKLHFFGGPRAALMTPQACGEYTTTTDMTPWSENGDAHPSDSFSIGSGPGGGACVSSAGEAPNSPSFSAGTINPVAGAYSPFVLRLKREDGSQRLSRIDTVLPEGLVGKLAGIPYCPEAAIAAAAGKSGADEQASPSCPGASEIGSVVVGAGAGPQPYYVRGKAYLAGPYKGAPLSMVVVTPAVAGPFDLGTVVTRVALYVDPATAQITARSDALPSVLEGIPLDIRSVSLRMDRSRFTLNPTSCKATQVGGTALSLLGNAASLSDRFQVGECAALGFQPKLGLRLFGKAGRGAHPRLRAVLKMPKGGANIARTSVALPHSEFLDQGHLNNICTRVQFAEGGGNGAGCPAASIYGHAKAWSPLLDRPLEGPVYLRSSSHKLPDLVAALNGQIQIALDGRIDSVNGGIRTTFTTVPDAPVSRFVLNMQGGRKGLLQNSTNICRGTFRAAASFDAQNGKVSDSEPPLRDSRCRRG